MIYSRFYKQGHQKIEGKIAYSLKYKNVLKTFFLADTLMIKNKKKMLKNLCKTISRRWRKTKENFEISL
jgi:hypothetical protein